MNRETRRRLQKAGQIDEEGNPLAGPQRDRSPAGPGGRGGGPGRGGGEGRGGGRSRGEFIREVRAELKKVAWPTWAETRNYASVVLISLVVLTALIFVLDYGFAKSILFLFKT